MRSSLPPRSPVPLHTEPPRHRRNRLIAAVSASSALVLTSAVTARLDAAPINTADTVISSSGVSNPNSALGELNGDTGFDDFGFYYGGLNPFNPPFNAADIAVIDAGGSLTLETQFPFSTTGYNLGVYVNNGIQDVSASGTGRAGSPPAFFSSVPKAKVSVSYDGDTWEYLNGGNVIDFNRPTNVYLDTDISGYFQPLGDETADMAAPWVGELTDLSGFTYDEIRTAFNGSAGGNWLNLDPLTLDVARYVRFETTDSRMVVDAIATAESLPEPSAGLAIIGGLFLIIRRRRA